MSRQFDEYMEGKVEINGELYDLVEPTNFEELMQAYEMKNILETQYSTLMHDDDSKDGWLTVLQEQEGYIQEYLDSLGEFDNSCLISNITYLTKKNSMRIGDLETALGLSAGYISRTAKADTKKKMSIDVVWKIAQLFEVGIKDLVSKDLSMPEHGMIMLTKFIDKLKKMTVANEILWENHGGYIVELNPKYVAMGLIKDSEDGGGIYNIDCLNPNIKWMLTSDIYAYKNFEGGKELVIISFANAENEKNRIFDFLLVWNENGVNKWERVFCTADDAFSGLPERAADLVDTIDRLVFEPKISRKHRSMIAAFLKEGN